MLDINLLRSDPDVVRKDLKRRKDEEKLARVDEIIEKDGKWRGIKKEIDELRHERNELSKQVSVLKRDGKDASSVIKKVKDIPELIQKKEGEAGSIREDIDSYLMRLPNILAEDVPVGDSEEDNAVVREIGKKGGPAGKSHGDLLLEMGMADFERASKVAGSRFYYLKGDIVRLEYALLAYAMDLLQEKGYSPIETPYMLRRKPYEGVTDLHDFEDVMYKVDGEDLYLIATSEHAIAAMYMDEIIEAGSLPVKYAGITPCFRKEAGAHGKDTKGIFRVHQFNKVEQFVFCRPEESQGHFDEIVGNVEHLYKSLNLPYRIVSVCTGDIGSVAAKKYDLEVWMPVQQKYREAASVSDCTDYQARRLNIRYRGKDGNSPVHTLNGTMVATTRALVAIIESNQQKDGTVAVPKALVPYMNGKEFIGKA